MRRYLICYLKEKNDECHDLETIIDANTIQEALNKFNTKFFIYKRITTIKELINESNY
jgi:hypothetical protein